MMHFAFIGLGLLGLIMFLGAIFYRLKLYKAVSYKYSLVNYLASKGYKDFSLPRRVFFVLRLIILGLMVLLIFKPQFANYKNPAKIDGIDIMLVLDVSESMLSFDDINDRRTRFEVAKSEAIKFIEKRPNDSVGLVIFAKHAVTRSPLTLDKTMLKNIISDLKIGYIEGDGTAIFTPLLTAANRLKNSDAKSKVIIFLTDGVPNVKDVSAEDAIDILKKLGIRVYTIGIGSQEGGFVKHPYFGIVRAQNMLNIPLLENIAEQTGGEFFLAQNPKDMESIYSYIDKLEKNKHEAKIYYNYFDFFIPIIFVILGLMLLELILVVFVWAIL